jgi:nuclear protein localization family protein 4
MNKTQLTHRPTPPQQDELSLLCRVATSKDAALGAQLMHSPGWATLETILQQM